MKLTTPTYVEEHTGKARFKIDLPKAPLGATTPGKDVMLLDIYYRMHKSMPSYEQKLEQLQSLVSSLKLHPDKASFDSWKFDPSEKGVFGHVVIRKKDLEILLNDKIERTLQEKQKFDERQLKLKQEKEAEKIEIMSKLYEIEHNLDETTPTQTQLLQYKRALRKFKTIIQFDYADDETFESVKVVNQETGKYSVKTISHEQLYQFINDLLDMVSEKLQGVNLQK